MADADRRVRLLALLMQSSQFCRCVSVPSPLDRTWISGSGASVPAAFGASSR
jgi:hypothetical protein